MTTLWHVDVVDYPVWIRVGWCEGECDVPQQVKLSMHIGYSSAELSLREGLQQENLEHVVDYAKLLAVIDQHAEQAHFRLLENYLQSLASCIESHFSEISELRLQVQKIRIPGCIHRGSRVMVSLQRDLSGSLK